jgi:hypothetical protein
MEIKINISAILKDCPRGTKLYSTIHGEIEFVDVYNNLIRCKNYHDINFISFYSDGRWLENLGECILFPSKENRDWSKFNRPFKDGDILAVDDTVFIYNGMEDLSPIPGYYVYVIADKNGFFAINTSTKKYGSRFATEEEKNILFEAIKNNGYKWYPDTKSLVKLFKPIFKVGDTIKNKTDKWLAKRTIKRYVEGIGYFTTINDWVRINDQDNWELVKDITPTFKIGDKIKKKDGSDYRLKTIESINNNYYIIKTPDWFVNCYITDKLPFNCQDEYELVHSNRFDINTLKPFESRVLVRDTDHYEWEGAVFGRYDGNTFFTIGGVDWKYCIPYEGNEHLLGTTDDCDEKFKIWE